MATIEELYTKLKEISLDKDFMEGMYDEETRELFSQLVEKQDNVSNMLEGEDRNTLTEMKDELDSKLGGIEENGHYEVEEGMMEQDDLDELKENVSIVLGLIHTSLSSRGGRRKKGKKTRKTRKTRKIRKSKKSKKTRKH
jgi:hypothetical protein